MEHLRTSLAATHLRHRGPALLAPRVGAGQSASVQHRLLASLMLVSGGIIALHAERGMEVLVALGLIVASGLLQFTSRGQAHRKTSNASRKA